MKKILLILSTALLTLVLSAPKAHAYDGEVEMVFKRISQGAITPENPYVEFQVLFFNECGYNSWCSSFGMWVDDVKCNLPELETSSAPDEKSYTHDYVGQNQFPFRVTTSISFDSKLDDYWATIRVYFQMNHTDEPHRIRFRTYYVPNSDSDDKREFNHTYDVNCRWAYPAVPKLTGKSSKNVEVEFAFPQEKGIDYLYGFLYKSPVALDKEPFIGNDYCRVNESNSDERPSKRFRSFNVSSNYQPTQVYPCIYSRTKSNGNISYFQNKWSPVLTPHFPKAANLQVAFDQWSKSCQLKWLQQTYDQDASTDGVWLIARNPGNSLDIEKLEWLDNIAVGTHEYKDAGNTLDYNKQYTYLVTFVPKTWGTPTRDNFKSLIDTDLSSNQQVRSDAQFPISLTATSKTEGILLNWEAPAIGQKGNIRYKIYRGVNGTTQDAYIDVLVTNFDQTCYETLDHNNLESTSDYTYHVEVELMGGQVFKSNEVTQVIDDHSGVTALSITKGSLSNAIKLKWQSHQVGSNTTYYEVFRRVSPQKGEQASNNWQSLYSCDGTASSYTWTDNTITNGVFYDYKVRSWSKKGSSEFAPEEVIGNGFSSLTGTISGAINYDGGTAVQGVRVTIEPAEDFEYSDNYALEIKGNDGGIIWDVPDEEADKDFVDKEWHVQMFVYPRKEKQKNLHIAQLGNLIISVGSFSKGHFRLFANNQMFPDIELKQNEFTSLSLGYRNGTLTAITYDRKEHSQRSQVEVGSVNFDTDHRRLYFGGSSSIDAEEGFDGYIDDVRIFGNHYLSDEEIEQNHCHFLSGLEKGLVAYWPLDEGLEHQRDAYDYSTTSGAPNENHGQIRPNGSNERFSPDQEQLSQFSYTDEYGNYIIRGIHYYNSGTNYIVRPTYGVHTFAPATQTRYISANSTVYSGTDFTDNSSFEVSGTVYYQGTNYPVKGAKFKVDGVSVTQDGEEVETDDQGCYTLRVPIGNHRLTCYKDGHTFVNQGNYPATGKHDFNDEIRDLTFYDETLVTLAGRVNGGGLEYDKPLGFNTSVNNIGVAKIVLRAGHMLNAKIEADGDAVRYVAADEDRRFGDGSEGRVKSDATVGYGTTEQAQLITIYTDKTSGEFAVKLPPVVYDVVSVSIPKNNEVNFTNYPTCLDLSDVLSTKHDSIKLDDQTEPLYFEYLKDFRLSYRHNPAMTVQQIAPMPDVSGFYGESRDSFTDSEGEIHVIDMYNETQGYLYGVPIFNKENSYKFRIQVGETYVNYDTEGNPVERVVPSAGTDVTIRNDFAMASWQQEDDGTYVEVKSNKIRLDSLGTGLYFFKAGFPNMSESDGFVNNLAISYNVDGVNYDWKSPTSTDGVFRAVVTGSEPQGSGFVTEGPKLPVLVLRDPPGSKSSASMSKGHTSTDSYTVRSGNKGNEYGKIVNQFGSSVTSFTVVGFAGTITNKASTVQWTVDSNFTQNSTHNNTSTLTTTLNETLSTSSDKNFDGPDADLYYGVSTNYVLGEAKDLGFYDDGSGNPKLQLKTIMVNDITFSTTFAFTGFEIENKQIPRYERWRNSMILPMGSTPKAGEQPQYVSKVAADDSNFGLEGYYELIPQIDQEKTCIDSVSWCNMQINSWKDVLATNEAAKIYAIQHRDATIIDNFSIDGGASLSRSFKASETYSQSNASDYSEAVKNDFTINHKFSFVLLAHAKTISFGGGYEHTHGDTYTSTQANDSTVSFTLNDGDINDNLTVDVHKAPDGFGPIFVTRGGQTSNNWEPGRTTKYAQPGTEIMTRTQRVHVPKLTTETPIINNVRKGTSALVKLRLNNLSEARRTGGYTLYLISSTAQGAEVRCGASPLSSNSGVSYTLTYDTPVDATVTVRQVDPDVTDYNLAFYLADNSQPTNAPTYKANTDTCWVQIQFVEASSEISLAASTTVVNQSTGPKVKFTLSDYDLQMINLQTLALEYRGVNDQKWGTLETWSVHNEKDPSAVLGSQITYELDMSDISHYPDQEYLFRAKTISQFGTKMVEAYSTELSIVKDLSAPALLGDASPANGVYTIGSEVSVSFNEDIRQELITPGDNVQLKGVLNKTEITHEVSMLCTGDTYARSDARINMTTGNLSIGMWLKREEQSQPGTLLSHSTQDNPFEIGLDAEGHLQVRTGKNHYTSSAALPVGQWLFLALSLNVDAPQPLLTADYAVEATEVNLFDHYQIAPFTGNIANIQLGKGFHGYMHDVAIWDNVRSFATALSERNRAKSPYTSHLLAYWPLRQGYGSVAEDEVNCVNLALPSSSSWHIDRHAYSLPLQPEQQAMMNLSNCATTSDDDYLVQFWFRADSVQAPGAHLYQIEGNSAYIGFGKDGKLYLFGSNDNQAALHTESMLDGQWHRFALAVNKSTNGNGIVYIDNKSLVTFSALNASNLGRQMLLGGNFSGNIDELRIWHGLYRGDMVDQNMYDCLSLESANPVCYLPFETTKLNEYNQPEVCFTTEDLSQNQCGSLRIYTAADDEISVEGDNLHVAPVKSAPAMKNVKFDLVKNERKLVLNISEEIEKIEGCTLFASVRDIKDHSGNVTGEFSWSFLVEMNQLCWKSPLFTLTGDYLIGTEVQLTIVNNTLVPQNWSLEGVPAWLNFTTQSGSIQSQSQLTLSAIITQDIPVGCNKGLIYLVESNGISHGLHYEVNYLSGRPNWNCDASQYANTMSVTGQVRLNGERQENPNSILAAFDSEGNCIGLTQPQFYPEYNASYFLMQIYGEGKGDAPIEFRYYDANRGVMHPSVALYQSVTSIDTTQIYFMPNAAYGNFSYPLIWQPDSQIEQTITLQTGWNLVSINVFPTSTRITNAFGSTDQPSLYIINNNQAATYTDGHYSGNFSSLVCSTAYLIKANVPTFIKSIGIPVSSLSTPIEIPIVKGWNWVGANVSSKLDIRTALADLDAETNDLIKTRTGHSIFEGNTWTGQITTIDPGQGYLYHTNSDTEDKMFHYPSDATTVQTSAAPRMAPAYTAGLYYGNLDTAEFSGRMLVIAQVEAGGRILPGVEVAAFDQYEHLRGEKHSIDSDERHLIYLVLHGEQNAPLRFEVICQTGQESIVVECDQTFEFEDCKLMGTPEAPYIFHIADPTAIRAIGADDRVSRRFDLLGRPADTQSRGFFIEGSQKVVR